MEEDKDADDILLEEIKRRAHIIGKNVLHMDVSSYTDDIESFFEPSAYRDIDDHDLEKDIRDYYDYCNHCNQCNY